MRWLKSFGAGVLAELATIALIVATVTLYKATAARTAAEIEAFGGEVGALVGGIGGAVMVFLLARWITRRVPGRHVAHGMVVALGAIALHLIGLLAGGAQPLAAAAAGDLLKLAAGAYAGFISARSAERRKAPTAK
jgi:hypothetical protein